MTYTETAPSATDFASHLCKCGAYIHVAGEYVFRCRTCKRGYCRTRHGMRTYRPGEKDPKRAEWEDVK